ncbi:MAG: radical SAM protein, partial [Gemmatimonadetes bacterium]|nr:radical SAM protein [Gemmatimonadota bacterium]
PENVVAELAWLKSTYAPDHVWFADDIMGLKPGWWPRFAELVEAQDAGLPFKCLSRADLLLREGEIAAIRRAGAEIVWVGAESGSQKILDAMEKGTRVEQIREATRQLQRAGVRVGFFLQFGYPGETRADIDATFRLLREGAPDEIGVSVSYPLPGTKFYERVKHDLGEQQNWLDSDDLAMLYRGPYTTDFYRQLHVLVHTQFKAQRHWRELRRLLREPGRIRVRHLRRVGGLALAGARLPLERYRLRRLERRSHNGIGALPVELTPEAAATPGS